MPESDRKMSDSIEDKVDSLTKAVTDLTLEVRTWRAEQAQICLGHKATMDKLNKTVFDGNGVPSLQSQVASLQATMNFIKVVLGLLAPGVIALLGNAIWHFLKTG